MDGGLVRRAVALGAPLLLAALTWSALSPQDPPATARPAPPPVSPSPVSTSPVTTSPPPLVTVADDTVAYFPAEDTAATVIERARGYFETRPGVYGGGYLDREARRAVVLVTRDRARHEEALRELAGDDAGLLAVRTVAYALADLERVAAVVGDRTGVSFVSVDERENRVVVALPEDTAARRRPVLRGLPERDAAMLRFVVGPRASFG
jgi:hypothetical protein